VPVPGIVVCLVVLVGGSFFLGRELGWLEAAEARQDLTNLVDED